LKERKKKEKKHAPTFFLFLENVVTKINVLLLQFVLLWRIALYKEKSREIKVTKAKRAQICLLLQAF